MIVDTLLIGATAPGSTGASPVIAPPGSAVLQPEPTVRLLAVYGLGQIAGYYLQVTTPSAHDTTRGWRVGGGSTTARLSHLLAHWPWTPRVRPSETLAMTIGGSSTAGDIELAAILVAYPGLAGEYITAAQAARVEHVTTMTGALTPSTSVAWPTGTTLAAFQDTLRAGERYAVLGATVMGPANILGLAIHGPDLGNYRYLLPVVGQEHSTETPYTAVRLAQLTGLPCVPTIQSDNRTQTTVALVGNEESNARTVSLILGLLPRGSKVA